MHCSGHRQLPAPLRSPPGVMLSPCRPQHLARTFLTWTRQAHSVSSTAGVLQLWNELLRKQHRPSATGSEGQGGAGGWPEADTLLKEQLRAFQGHVDGALLPEQVHLDLIHFYNDLSRVQRAPFLTLLAQRLGVQEREVNNAISQWQQVLSRSQQPPSGTTSTTSTSGTSSSSGAGEGGGEALQRAADKLRAAAQPLYSQLFGPISREPGGIPFLVSLRSHVREALGAQPAAGTALRGLDAQLKQALSSWFSPGLLECRLVTWQDSPAVLLEKLVQYEAVHPLADWQDLKRRLGPDRRVHVYLHPCLPGEPLVILHAALMTHVPTCMDEVLLPDTEAVAGFPAPSAPGRLPSAPSPPSVAAFYSISSTQPGLAGVDLGHFLIMQVAKKIQAELPSIHQLVTLSPLPGFRTWLQSRLAALALDEQQQQTTPTPTPTEVRSSTPNPPTFTKLGTTNPTATTTGQPNQPIGTLEPPSLGNVSWVGVLPGSQTPPPLITPEEAVQLLEAAPQLLSKQDMGKLEAAGGSAAACLALLLEGEAWQERGRGSFDVLLQRLLQRAAARYLILERRRSLALDAVAHFHLRNGAQLLRINPRSDMSEEGLKRSYGVMVNYQYDLTQVDSNNRAYLMEHQIQASSEVMHLLGTEAD